MYGRKERGWMSTRNAHNKLVPAERERMRSLQDISEMRRRDRDSYRKKNKVFRTNFFDTKKK